MRATIAPPLGSQVLLAPKLPIPLYTKYRPVFVSLAKIDETGSEHSTAEPNGAAAPTDSRHHQVSRKHDTRPQLARTWMHHAWVPRGTYPRQPTKYLPGFATSLRFFHPSSRVHVGSKPPPLQAIQNVFAPAGPRSAAAAAAAAAAGLLGRVQMGKGTNKQTPP